MSVEKVRRAGGVVWRVRWRHHGRNRAQTFSTRCDAAHFDAELRRLRRPGSLAAIDAGTETLGEYVTGTWAATHAATLAPKTRGHYAGLYDCHIRAFLGAIPLRDISPETIGRWQADRLADGAGPVAVCHAMDLLGWVLEHVFIAGRIAANPARRVKKARRPRREEVQALSPSAVEAMRSALGVRDATLVSVPNRGAGEPSDALRVQPGSRMRVHTTYVIASLHCSCTRSAASSTLHASSVTTPG